MKALIYILAAAALFGQAQTPLTVYQSSGSATGAIRLQERRTNGTDYVGLKGPDSIATSFNLTLPSADGTVAGLALQTDAAGALSFREGLTSLTSTASFHESFTLRNTNGVIGDAPAIYWRQTTTAGAGTATGDISVDTISLGSGTHTSGMTFRVAKAGTVTEFLRLNGSTGFVEMDNGYLEVGGGSEPYTKVHFSDYAQVALGKEMVVDVWQGTPTSDSGAGKFEMRRISGAGTIAGGNRTDVRALETHTTCEYGTGYCWAQEVRIGSAISPVTQTIQNVGVMIESKSAGWITSPNCNGSGAVGCQNNMGVVVLGVDGWEWPYAYLDTANRVDWFVDDVGRTNTRGLRFLDVGGVSGYSIYWEAQAVATTNDSSWVLKDNGGSNVLAIYRKISGVADANAYWGVSLNPATNLGASLGNSSLYWNNVYGLNFTTGPIVPTAANTYSIGANSNRYLRVFTGGVTTAGASFWESGSDFTMRTGSTMTLEFGTPGAGKVLTSDAAGVATWQVSGSSQWTRTGSDIYYNTGSVWVGHTANNISAKLEIENSASVNLLQLKYTGAVATNSGGGISAHQGSAPTAADQRLGFMVFGAEISGTQYNRAAIMAFSGQTWTVGAAEGEYLQFLTTSNGSTTRTARHRIDSNGDWLPESNNAYAYGSTSLRPSKVWTTALDASGVVNFSGSTITASSTFSSDLIATTGSTYALGSSSKRWLLYASTANISSTLTLGGSITGDIAWSAGSTYNVGSSGTKTLGVYANYVDVYTTLTMHIGSGIVAQGGASGTSVTLTCGAGQAVKNLTVDNGIVTGASCGAP